jgi:hypothetical protein
VERALDGGDQPRRALFQHIVGGALAEAFDCRLLA